MCFSSLDRFLIVGCLSVSIMIVMVMVIIRNIWMKLFVVMLNELLSSDMIMMIRLSMIIMVMRLMLVIVVMKMLMVLRLMLLKSSRNGRWI